MVRLGKIPSVGDLMARARAVLIALKLSLSRINRMKSLQTGPQNQPICRLPMSALLAPQLLGPNPALTDCSWHKPACLGFMRLQWHSADLCHLAPNKQAETVDPACAPCQGQESWHCCPLDNVSSHHQQHEQRRVWGSSLSA